jgi:hypothetical protein
MVAVNSAGLAIVVPKKNIPVDPAGNFSSTLPV